MSRLLVDDVTKTDARALLNVNKMATISDIVAPSNEYIYASGANELTVVEGCVIAVGGAGIFKTANTILTAANLDAGSAFAVGKDYYVYICDSRIDSADEKYVISLNSTYPTGWNATNSRKIGGFHYGRCRKVDSNLQPLNGSSVIFGTGWESAVSNGIVPRSVWTLGHRPKCSPEGMVYLGGGTWVDIYLNSDDGAKRKAGFMNMTITEFIEAAAHNKIIQLVVLAIVCDTVFGVLRAIKEKKFNSCAGIDGAIRKVGMLISLVFMLAIDVLIKINLIGFIPEQARTYLGLDTVGVAEFFALLYIAYEVVSIFKNMALCGLPVKKVWEKVREFLAKYTDELPDTDELDGDSTTGNVEEHRTQER